MAGISAEQKDKIIQGLESFRNKRILVIGDIGVDEYVMGEVRRISPEAPVPVLEVETEMAHLGLSGNVAQNVVSLGAQASIVSVVGADDGAEKIRHLLRQAQVDDVHLVVDPLRPTTKKIRIMAKHHHLVRVDFEKRDLMEESVDNEIFTRVQKALPHCDIIILEDYSKGVLSRKLVERVTLLGKAGRKMVLMDPHRTNSLDFYQGVDLLKPNFEEALALAGMTYEDFHLHKKDLKEVGQKLLHRLQAQHVIITQGKEGMTLFSKDSSGESSSSAMTTDHFPTFARQVYDVTGAGDTVIAALALGIAGDFTMPMACTLANFAAGVVVGHVGCVPCKKPELIEYIRSHP